MTARSGTIALMIAVALSIAATAQNGQRIIPLGDRTYQVLDALYLETGIARYSGARPCSADELILAFSRIRDDRLSERGKRLLQTVSGSLHPSPLYTEGTGFSFDASVAGTLEGYYHVAIDPSGRNGYPYTWTYGFENRLPFLKADADIWASGFFWAGTSFEFKEEYRAIDDRMSPEGKSAGNAERNYSSIPSALRNIDTFFPFRGLTSIGNEILTLSFGRDRISYGNGRSGNMILSSFPDFYDSLRFTLFSGAFKFSSVFISCQPDRPKDQIFSGFTAHRLEFAPIGQIRLSVTESMAMGGAGIEPDYVHDLNPVAVYHAWLAPERANSLMSLELDVTPIPGIRAYGQFAMDDFQTKAESDAGSNDKANAFGLIAGLECLIPLETGRIEAGFEFAKTDPWLYNRFQAPYYRYQRRIWSFVDPPCDEWIIKPYGYEAGPDAIVNLFRVAYDPETDWTCELDASWKMKGEIDLLTPYPISGSPDFDARAPSGTVEHALTASISGSYSPFAWLSAGATFGVIRTENTNHSAGASTTDMEMSAYVRLSLD